MENIKVPFFKRLKKAVIDFESYSDFAVEKLNIAIKYIAKLTLIFAIIISIAYTFQFSQMINNEEQLQIIRNQMQETSGLEIDAIEQLIQNIKNSNNFEFYANLALTLSFSFFASIFVYSLIYAIMVSIMGLLVSRIARIRLKYKPIYIMSMYALTLPIILNCIYAVTNVLTGFTIDYFQIVYASIACIYIVTAILMIKTDFIEQQRELIKIVQEQRKVKYEQREDKEDEKKKEPVDDKDKKENPPTEEPLGDADGGLATKQMPNEE